MNIWAGRIASETARAFQPYQTKPGEQMQYDWAEYRVHIGETVSRVYVHQRILERV